MIFLESKKILKVTILRVKTYDKLFWLSYKNNFANFCISRFQKMKTQILKHDFAFFYIYILSLSNCILNDLLFWTLRFIVQIQTWIKPFYTTVLLIKWYQFLKLSSSSFSQYYLSAGSWNCPKYFQNIKRNISIEVCKTSVL